MLERITSDELSWFAAWADRDDGWLPAPYRRQIVIPNPGAEPASDGDLPFRGPASAEGHPSAEQKAAIEAQLLAVTPSDAPAYLASYDGTPDLVPSPPLDAVAERVSGYVDYLLVAGPLQALVFSSWERRWSHEQPVSMLWPSGRAWCLAVDPDLVFSVVGCDDILAERLLRAPVLHSREWPGADR